MIAWEGKRRSAKIKKKSTQPDSARSNLSVKNKMHPACKLIGQGCFL